MIRLIQLITGIHRIHHVNFGYGWKLLFLPIGYFPDFRAVYELQGAKRLYWIKGDKYHNCTLSGVY